MYRARMGQPITSDAADRRSSDLFDDDSILPADPVDDDGTPLEVLHDREYRVRAYRKADDRLLIRGAVRDQKPPGLYIDTDERPLVIHHMQIDIEVSYPSLEIVDARVGIETYPHRECPRIVDHYDALVGLSITRGFTHRVRELFGGPRGCTHTTALLQAMAPVAVQCMMSMRAVAARRSGGPLSSGLTPEQRRGMREMNLNTCHVWAADGEWALRIDAGEEMAPPIWAEERLVSLGLELDTWRSGMGD